MEDDWEEVNDLPYKMENCSSSSQGNDASSNRCAESCHSSSSDKSMSLEVGRRNGFRSEEAAATEENAMEDMNEQRKKPSSVLRSSIARYGSNSYYYAHAHRSTADLLTDKNVKIIRAPGVVTGGPPILLGRDCGSGSDATAATDAQRLSPAAAATAAAQGKRLSGFRILQSYMWTEDGAKVRVYIFLEKLPESPEEKAAEPHFDANNISASFEDESAALVIYRKAGAYLLNLKKLFFPVKAAECRVVIKEDKVTLTLIKEDEHLTWFSLLKSK